MEFYIVTNQPIIADKIEKLKNNTHVLDPSDFRRKVKESSRNEIFYLDIEAFKNDWEKEFKYAQKNDKVFLALIDLQGKVKDIGTYIYKGIVDYIGKDNGVNDFSKRRFIDVENYLENYRCDYFLADEEDELEPGAYKIAEKGWATIRSDEEYTFYIMYVELDDKKEMEKSFAKSNLKLAIDSFKRFVEQNVARFEGKLWIWQGFGGVVLFPFNGHDCPAALSGFRMAIYKHLHDVEESLFPHFISYRMAIHLGNVLYQEENTGNVIADTINSVFHLGSKYAEPGEFYMTDDTYRFIHPKIKPYFKASGEFEGRNIWRMRRPIIGAFRS
ncbi:MAG: adenylate/guanylate cyclase domain-containing protein [Spirochaetales bacterium]|nr:adenylate/guanylate cyclase domain-containing protein [Spirochaetales bacterium]